MEFYHATLKSNYESIMRDGLIPQVGERSAQLDEEEGIFLFTNYNDCEIALLNWLGEAFDEIEPYEEVITLKINLPDDFPLEYDENVGYEVISRYFIPAEYIEFYKCEG